MKRFLTVLLALGLLAGIGFAGCKGKDKDKPADAKAGAAEADKKDGASADIKKVAESYCNAVLKGENPDEFYNKRLMQKTMMTAMFDDAFWSLSGKTLDQNVDEAIEKDKKEGKKEQVPGTCVVKDAVEMSCEDLTNKMTESLQKIFKDMKPDAKARVKKVMDEQKFESCGTVTLDGGGGDPKANPTFGAVKKDGKWQLNFLLM